MKSWRKKGIVERKDPAVSNHAKNDSFAEFAAPFYRRLFRTALILTSSPRYAVQLVQATHSKARKIFHQIGIKVVRDGWLVQLLIDTYRTNIQRFKVGKK